MRYITMFFFFCYCSVCFSQYKFPKQEYAQLVLDSKLVVELLDGESEYNAIMNSSVKEVFINNWKHTEVLFLTRSGIDSLRNIHKNGYSFLYQKASKYSERRFREDNLGRSSTYEAFTFSSYRYFLNILIEGKNHFVTSIDFGTNNLIETDHLFLYQQLSLLIQASAEGKKPWHFFKVNRNLEQLKNSTLVMPRFLFKEKDSSKIEDYYKHDYQLVDFNAYQELILNKETGKSYIKIIWSPQHKLYMWIVVNASDGAILSINSFGGLHFSNEQTVKEVIKVKYLKYATSKLAQKVNNRYGWKLKI
ncbi:hypothetical protein N7U66_03325 [Lacinutrix neustonica]|uniref:Uncharacterized protein n=1 Tax=Lacinutrix neustonica TaxID=2980107 RepID=A0A9E8MYR4_9FLAO|nr:hypothetical protein [Lacinutrix neustonica]WAC02715.1 hypothetical protein N7U66_03325 [Lacinutrix neustonica]